MSEGLGYKVWETMDKVIDSMLLDKASPNKTLVEEALSFNAADLHSISDEKLRQYLVVLGQYQISLHFEENKTQAIAKAWSKALDSRVYKVMSSESFVKDKSTVKERQYAVLQQDEEACDLNSRKEVAEAKAGLISNMSKQIEAYTNTLKREVDARENEKSRHRY